MQYSDDDLTFFMLVHQDHEMADRCLARLRSHYPKARVVIRSDGDLDSRHQQFVQRYGVDYRAEERLFPVENGGAIIARMFEIYLERPTAYLFKLDPDTAVHRRFLYLPARDGHFGMLQGPPGSQSIQGGCMGFTQAAARQILTSQLLACDDLKDPCSVSDRSGHWQYLADRAVQLGLASFDWSLAWVALELRVPVFEFPEVHATWKVPVDNSCLAYAITHPVL